MLKDDAHNEAAAITIDANSTKIEGQIAPMYHTQSSLRFGT